MERISVLRNDILVSLASAGSNWVSGEELADLFGISRAAVGKHVRTLRKEGNIIEAVPSRGYRLISQAAPWAGDNLPRKLLKTSRLGQGKWLWLKETDSTNLVLMREALAGAEEGTVAVARHQNQGRGSKGRSWMDAPGCLMFSVLLRPALPAGRVEDLVLCVLQSCQKALLDRCGTQVDIKLPNDIMLHERKIGGVLVESMFHNNFMTWAVAGIGVNVNVPDGSLPKELLGKASSIYAETSRPSSVAALLAGILEEIEERLPAE
ncbi:MAG: biotin--[acetyl-CoA-carboxylase] ligase [Mailhella sp.]|nr:biotin--[acetyl-CoA-carboxylase] ligase [Mailhella sp.]